MTPAERKAVAETLREWAAWCEANPSEPWWQARRSGPVEVFAIAIPFMESYRLVRWYHRGLTAATGLCLAAAMVEAGDGV